MDRDDFERCLSEWLDDPHCDGLHSALQQAIGESPQLRAVRADWERLNELVRGASRPPNGVEWDRLRRNILRAVLGEDRHTGHGDTKPP